LGLVVRGQKIYAFCGRVKVLKWAGGGGWGVGEG